MYARTVTRFAVVGLFAFSSGALGCSGEIPSLGEGVERVDQARGALAPYGHYPDHSSEV
jgi:hypothetical protein